MSDNHVEQEERSAQQQLNNDVEMSADLNTPAMAAAAEEPDAAAAAPPAEESAAPDAIVAINEINPPPDIVMENNAAPNPPPPEEPDEMFYGFEEPDSSIENADLTKLLQIWEANHTRSGFDPVPLLKKLAEIMETEKEIYMRKDPDPFDDRHPYRVDNSCQFGFLLKQLFRKDQFMNKLVNDYLRDNYFTRQNVQKSALELNILACRLVLVIMPGLETSAVFQAEFDNLINRIYSWAEDSIEPLQSYATGLLASAMEVTEIAVQFRELNTRLVPKMLKRLRMLQAFCKSTRNDTPACTPTHGTFLLDGYSKSQDQQMSEKVKPTTLVKTTPAADPVSNIGMLPTTPANAKADDVSMMESYSASFLNILLENSMDGSSSATNIYKKTYIPVYPASAEASQMLIMRYLTSMGEYQEFLGLVFENCAMDMIFGYMENMDRRDTCLVFEALKYLASLLCHKKFALEFIARGGLERLLKVPRPSVAATGVSIALYYLAYSEDAMERICTFSRPLVAELVRYALWILGHSYDSGRCHATMFFGLSFQFKVILEEFDAQDGLRKLYNVVSSKYFYNGKLQFSMFLNNFLIF